MPQKTLISTPHHNKCLISLPDEIHNRFVHVNITYLVGDNERLRGYYLVILIIDEKGVEHIKHDDLLVEAGKFGFSRLKRMSVPSKIISCLVNDIAKEIGIQFSAASESWLNDHSTPAS